MEEDSGRGVCVMVAVSLPSSEKMLIVEWTLHRVCALADLALPSIGYQIL